MAIFTAGGSASGASGFELLGIGAASAELLSNLTSPLATRSCDWVFRFSDVILAAARANLSWESPSAHSPALQTSFVNDQVSIPSVVFSFSLNFSPFKDFNKLVLPALPWPTIMTGTRRSQHLPDSSALRGGPRVLISWGTAWQEKKVIDNIIILITVKNLGIKPGYGGPRPYPPLRWPTRDMLRVEGLLQIKKKLLQRKKIVAN